MQPVVWNPDTESPPAFAGTPGDSGIGDKVGVPCGAAPQRFGTVVASVKTTGVSVLPIDAAQHAVEGVALHAHHPAGRVAGQDGYVQGDMMSVKRRGRIWALASGACAKDAVAKYDPATGVFGDAGTATYPGARFLTADAVVMDIGGAGSQRVVFVGLGRA
jgi:hypothetical protein